MKHFVRFITGILFIAALHTTLRAQESFTLTPPHGIIGISFGRSSESSLETSPGSYRSAWLDVNTEIPVWRSQSEASEGVSLQRYAVSGSYKRTTMVLPLEDSRRTMNTAGFGGSGLWLTPSKEFYTLSASVGIDDDSRIDAPIELRVRLTALGSYHISQPMTLLYGANYSALFGRDLLLPILGMHWKMERDWSGTVILPFALSVKYAASRDLSLKAAVTASGDRMRIANEREFEGAPAVLQARSKGAKASVALSARLSDEFGLRLETGALVRRKFEVTSGDETLLSSQVNPAGFITLGIQFHFFADSLSDDLF